MSRAIPRTGRCALPSRSCASSRARSASSGSIPATSSAESRRRKRRDGTDDRVGLMPLLPALVTALALALYLGTVIAVMRARGHYGIAAPATSGHPVFERLFRIQQNTLEQLVLFLPALWLYSLF